MQEHTQCKATVGPHTSGQNGLSNTMNFPCNLRCQLWGCGMSGISGPVGWLVLVTQPFKGRGSEKATGFPFHLTVCWVGVRQTLWL